MPRQQSFFQEFTMAFRRTNLLLSVSCAAGLALCALADPAAAAEGEGGDTSVGRARHHRSHHHRHREDGKHKGKRQTQAAVKLEMRAHHGGHHHRLHASSVRALDFGPAGGADAISEVGSAGPLYSLAVGFGAPELAAQSPHMQVVRREMQRELGALPGVAMAGGEANTERGPAPQRFFVDGAVWMQSTAWSGGQRIGCSVQAIVSSWPAQIMQMISVQEATIETGSTAAAESDGQRDCLRAAVGGVRADIGRFLRMTP